MYRNPFISLFCQIVLVYHMHVLVVGRQPELVSPDIFYGHSFASWLRGGRRVRSRIKGYHTRKPRTREHCENLSKALKGRVSWRKGKPYPQLSERQRGEGNHMYGKHLSIETKRKLSLRFGGKNNPMYGKKGKDSPAWKGGTTLLWHIKAIPEYVRWRKAVYRRDNYICQHCGYSDGHILHAHHIKPFAKIMKEYKIHSVDAARQCMELWDVDNGITLCIPCHAKTDTYARTIMRLKRIPLLIRWMEGTT